MADSLLSDLGVVALRYAVVVLFAAGIFWSVKRRAAGGPVVLAGVLGLVSWSFTWWPLERPYDLVPGSTASLELAGTTSAAAGGSLLSSWVVERASRRPLWGTFWRALCPGRPGCAIRGSRFVAGGLVALLSLILFALLRWIEPERAWAWSAASFAAVLASSPPLDAFRPFGFWFESAFLVSPAEPLALLLAFFAACVLIGGSTKRSRSSPGDGWPWNEALAGAVLGMVAWIDEMVFLWGAGSFLALFLLDRFRSEAPRPRRYLLALAVGLVLAAPRLLYAPTLGRVPTAEEVVAYRAAFGDLLSVTGDLEWLFVLAIVGAVASFRRDGAADRLLLALWSGSYLLWVVTAVVYSSHPLADPGIAFHAVRFTSGVLAGWGGYRCALWLIERAKNYPRASARLLRWVTSARSPSLATTITLVFLFPTTFPFTWQPLKMDPLYYESLRPLDADLVALSGWVRTHTAGDAGLLASSDTAEYLAALTGRKVYTAERVVGREEARRRRQAIRGMLRAKDAAELREALALLPIDWVVLDDAFRWEWGEAPEDLWRSSGLLVPVEGPTRAYRIYGVN